MISRQEVINKSPWLTSADIRPYVYVRPSNRITRPGARHHLDWFQGHRPVYINPLDLSQLEFAEQIYFLEGQAFGPSNMAMPRWVFYDCAVIPGFIAGFAMRTKSLPDSIKSVMRFDKSSEWTPLSLFIIIPTMRRGEWTAHNLCTINALLPEADRYYGLGFLSKAFGLWYANVETCCGITQWRSPSLKLHTHYGDFEIVTAYTPVHSYPQSLTYRLRVETDSWARFYSRVPNQTFHDRYQPAGFEINPTDAISMQAFQQKLQAGDREYFLNAQEIAAKDLVAPQIVYTPTSQSSRRPSS